MKASDLKDGQTFRTWNGTQHRAVWVYPTQDRKKIVIIYRKMYTRPTKAFHLVVDPDEVV